MTRASRPLAMACAIAGVAGCAPQLAWYGHTPDRAARIELRQRGGRQTLRVGDLESRPYAFIAVEELAFDPLGHRIAFAAEAGAKPERWTVVQDFVEGPCWEGVAGLRFGPGGRRFVYAAEQGGRWRMVVDGAAQAPYGDLDPASVAFSPDGRRVGYVADDTECEHAVVDGVSVGCGARIVGLAPGDDPTGDVLVIADRLDGSDAHVVVGGERVLDLARATELSVDARGKHWAVVAGAPVGVRLVTDDGQAGPSFERIDRVAWDPAGGSVAYASRREGMWHVVVGATTGPAFTEVDAPVYAGSGAHVGSIGRDPGHSVVTIDGRAVWESAAPATGLAMSDDGARVAWMYRDGDGAVIAVDGERYPLEVAVERTIRFTHDGRHWAALAGSLGTRSLFVVIDGRVRVPFDAGELFGDPGGDAAARLGPWVSAELERWARGGKGGA